MLASGEPASSSGAGEGRQVASQPSPFSPLPSSQTSPRSGLRSPQCSLDGRHLVVQPSVSTPFPSSHFSLALTIPSPQRTGVHMGVHDRLFSSSPSSQSSPGSSTPLPQPGLGSSW